MSCNVILQISCLRLSDTNRVCIKEIFFNQIKPFVSGSMEFDIRHNANCADRSSNSEVIPFLKDVVKMVKAYHKQLTGSNPTSITFYAYGGPKTEILVSLLHHLDEQICVSDLKNLGCPGPKELGSEITNSSKAVSRARWLRDFLYPAETKFQIL